MTRRWILAVLAAPRVWCASAAVHVRGKLAAGRILETADGKRIRLGGDAGTRAVLEDPRLASVDLEAVGRPGADEFVVDPIHKRALFVHQGGRRLMISFWCAVCSIRTYTPGQCMCCQDDTEVDLKESFDP